MTVGAPGAARRDKGLLAHPAPPRARGRVETRESARDVGSPGHRNIDGWACCDFCRCGNPAERRCWRWYALLISHAILFMRPWS
eukprot:COSAG02_NODE_1650_length_11487_cov_13.602895_9_plen_84_part_00